MFRSSFSKYLIAFVSIILISFLILSGIVTSMIRNYSIDEKENRLSSASRAVASQIEASKAYDLLDFVNSDIAKYLVSTITNLDSNIDIIIVDEIGQVYLATVDEVLKTKKSEEDTSLGTINFSSMNPAFLESDVSVYSGTMNNYLKEKSLICLTKIDKLDYALGYVLAISSTSAEDNLIGTARKAVVNSSIWVMLAAVIATYFITERLVNPLRNMTKAVRGFARGELATRVVVSGKDEVAELGDAFNHMAESLQNLEKMRNSFLANVSHDLRTPMTTIAGFIDGINSGAIPPEKHEYYLGIISDEIHRLSRLVSQLLDVSRLESGDRKFSLTHFDVAEVARIILISFEQKIEEKRLDVEFVSDNEKMFANADKDAIHQVLYNLCHNAIKFSREYGRLRIKLERYDEKKLRISVFDDGETLKGDDKQMVFDRFYKTDKSRGLDKNGVGLGLYICKTIIEAHGESIGVISEEGGCEFWFTLKEGSPVDRRIAKTQEEEA